MNSNLSTDKLARILWDYNNLNHTLKKADGIFVLGSNDIRVAQRGAELFLEGYAPLLIFSGNVGKLTKNLWDKTEAEVFAEEAIKMGVHKNKILIENNSTNTGENILFVRKLLNDRGVLVKSLILVQKPYMQRRAYATIKKLWSKIDVVVTAPQISFEDYPIPSLPKDYVINIMVGDTQRIKLYSEKGFQIPQDIPDDVWTAYEKLVKRGFTKHLVK